MEFTNFRFVFIQPDYLEALHNVDSEIFYSIDTDYSKKPHLGILTTCNGRKYVIPLTSAKRKHASWRDVTTTNYRVYEEIDTRATIVDKYDIIVDEISCQQLENVKEYHPNIAVLTNISEAHLEFMKTYEHYKEVKGRIFSNQTKDDIAVTNMENTEAMLLTKDVKSTVRYFSSKNQINGAYIKEGSIYYYDEKIVDLNQIKLIGNHNYENIMAAILVVKELGVNNDSICKVLKKFGGVEHRLEFVEEVDGRKFYNDTEATNIKCCQIALSSFKQPTILFLGGYERGQDFNELADYVENVKAIIAIGSCRSRVKEFGDKMNIPTYQYEFLKDAFETAWNISKSGDIILLSPASASWDQYKECEERGAEFKKYVQELIK